VRKEKVGDRESVFTVTLEEQGCNRQEDKLGLRRRLSNKRAFIEECKRPDVINDQESGRRTCRGCNPNRENRAKPLFLHPGKQSRPLTTVTPYKYSNQTCLSRAGAIELRQAARV
jgi:hypothetical protein